MTLPKEIEECLNLLSSNGHKAFVVGGAVRDYIMGRKISDYDITTDALPIETEAVFKGYKIIETGLKHGTVTVLINSMPIEITTFRTEGCYSDGRHPDHVDFTNDIVKDLSRRDFTVNSIAYSPNEGYVDPFGGIDDIRRKTIRCVGDPAKRFTEDALRILRAVRFSSVLRFEIESDTSNALNVLSDNLCLVSKERIRDEFKKLICGDGAFDVLTKYRKLIAIIIPEIAKTFEFDQNNPHHDFDLYTHIIKTVASLPADPIIRMAGLLHDIGKPDTESKDECGISHFYGHATLSAEIAEKILKDLRFSNAEISRAVTLIRNHDGVISETESAVKRKISKLGYDLFIDLLDLQRADNASQKLDSSFRYEHNMALHSIAQQIKEEKPCLNLSALNIDGNDLIALGYKGKEIGKALSILLDAVLNGESENSKEALIGYLNNIKR